MPSSLGDYPMVIQQKLLPTDMLTTGIVHSQSVDDDSVMAAGQYFALWSLSVGD